MNGRKAPTATGSKTTSLPAGDSRSGETGSLALFPINPGQDPVTRNGGNAEVACTVGKRRLNAIDSQCTLRVFTSQPSVDGRRG